MAKVVVVEDDALLAKMYVNLLTFENHQVVVANDGETALETIKNELPDIVLMDIMMPRMNGLQALEALKADPELAPIPVVVMSNMVNVNSPEEVLARGATKYIDKSQYDPKKVSQLVSEVLGLAGVVEVSAEQADQVVQQAEAQLQATTVAPELTQEQTSTPQQMLPQEEPVTQ